MLQEIDQHESPLLWVLVHENYFDDTLVRSFQADFHRRFQAPSFSTVSEYSCPSMNLKIAAATGSSVPNWVVG